MGIAGLTPEQQLFLEQLYRKMYYQLLDYATNALSNRALAEEAVQDAFRIACAKIDSCYASENPPGWLMNTLKYVIKNIRRSDSRYNRLLMQLFQEVSNHDAQTEDGGLGKIDTDIDLVQEIGAENYQLLQNVALHRYTMLEAAQELGISVEACKKRLQRIKKQLRSSKKFFN